ncbi:MAG: MAPEG family protein [Gammaproteobacteria bacterium]|nr:MAPEG family protein [Gammaproteobacteria bacterium]MDH5239414.1 MAPEG family protein [Gammaproteobacteria bacterium]MDH5260016.1 MAPEG family protein [Gammaproteobacteria bacterium]MDH5584106.1 MAPEG family protein [Gammaproteobacteria bacterium]
MEAVVIVTVLALAQYMFFGIQVGAARQKSGVKAPATSGDVHFECVNRVHQNTLEQLIVFIPALWLYAQYVNPLWGAGIGVVYLIGRLIYSAAYVKDPSSRSLGFTLSFLPGAVMSVWVLVVAVMHYV